MPLYRYHDSVLIDYETVPGINTFEFDSLVFENQAISPYTMQYFHKVIDPTHVLIPNIRLDHLESRGWRGRRGGARGLAAGGGEDRGRGGQPQRDPEGGGDARHENLPPAEPGRRRCGS
jgi:hypothetical protein